MYWYFTHKKTLNRLVDITNKYIHMFHKNTYNKPITDKYIYDLLTYFYVMLHIITIASFIIPTILKH